MLGKGERENCVKHTRCFAKRPSKRAKKGERGSALTEFGLVLVPTVGMMFLSMNVAWIFFGWASLQEAVREGVRYGITGPVSSGLDSAIENFTTSMSMGFINSHNNGLVSVNYFSPTTLTNVTGQSGATAAGNVLKVTATVSLKTLVPMWQSAGSGKWMGTFGSLTINLAASSADVLETATPPPSE